ncbi:hypothetical protein PV664_33910 [Streptomyces sp. ME01-18a]|uniref:hypothetical protein n=1 Tax=Streptomyces sp. ME01-18a TaxID=3028669 RepID=UPI0029B6C73A|nr:hypothetical protein [Streptomyces sp. ME01-18a]MDX3433881.1 hypothetical protein [Streptomyces sp. ME01-18a]
MIRLPSTHAAITAPLVASSADFPGILIGRSLLDNRPFRLSPVLTDEKALPSTNSLALGGLGSGKSTTAKIRIGREVPNGHQAVVIDTWGERNQSGGEHVGEWAAITRHLGGLVIDASTFTLNPCSPLFPYPVREQLIRSLIVAVEPDALATKATHALQHAMNHPKATSLGGLVDALSRPEDGQWPAADLAVWGQDAAIALSRYTQGSLRGLFDGQDADLPPTDLPILSFDFTRLDRNSPAIPSLMAAVTCWVEHVWLPQSTAVHRHIVLEEAWQILLSPATSELIQRLLKNSRKDALSVDAVMHTLSDLGDGKAQDLAKLVEIVHVGRLGPKEAEETGALLGLPRWAIDLIPTLGPGQAVWKVGPDYVDIIETVISEEEARLTDTSGRRRMARQGAAVEQETLLVDDLDEDQEDQEGDAPPAPAAPTPDDATEWAWEMPPGVVDIRHHDAIQAAMEGRCNEAADLAAIGEREDITAHGINSDEAVSWLSTRARVAEVCGSPDRAVQLRATVARMGKDDMWAGQAPDITPTPHPDTQQPTVADDNPTPDTLKRLWPAAAAIVALSLGIAFVWDNPGGEAKQRQQNEQRAEKAAAAAAAPPYEGEARAPLLIDGVSADLVADWTDDKERVIVKLVSPPSTMTQYLRIDVDDKSAVSEIAGGVTIGELANGRVVKTPEIVLPVKDPRADVTVRAAIGGHTWKKGSRAEYREIRLSPVTGTAYDAKTGKKFEFGD